MLHGLIGTETVVARLREGLSASTSRTRDIAQNVANASNRVDASFESALEGALRAGDPEVDLETEMVRLADEQIRFEATARALQSLYGQIRSAMRSG